MGVIIKFRKKHDATKFLDTYPEARSLRMNEHLFGQPTRYTPDGNHGLWTVEEQEQFMAAHALHGSDWTTIKRLQLIPSRTRAQVHKLEHITSNHHNDKKCWDTFGHSKR